jgi:uncharacterized protein (TIGR02246 family)
MQRAHTPRDCDRLFAEYVKAGDLDALVTLYEPDARLVHQDGTLAIGHEEIAASLRPIASARAEMRMNVVRSVVHGSLAMLHNDWELTMSGADGTPIESRGMAVELLRRQADGSWLFAIDDPFAANRDARS